MQFPTSVRRPRARKERSRRPSLERLLLIFSLPLLAGCGTLSNGRGWGQDFTPIPSRQRAVQAAKNAFLDPWTWAPLAGAGVLAIDDLDERISDWAVGHQPIFGSTENAQDWSDDLREALLWGSVASTLATDSTGDPKVWMPSKVTGLGLQFAAGALTGSLTDTMKSMTGRTRPSGTDDHSMPSRHTALAFSYTRWLSNNLDSISQPDELRWLLRSTAYGMAIMTGWARIEGAKHYPTDVLLGASLGNFVTSFIHDACLGLPGDVEVDLVMDPVGENYMVGLTWYW